MVIHPRLKLVIDSKDFLCGTFEFDSSNSFIVIWILFHINLNQDREFFFIVDFSVSVAPVIFRKKGSTKKVSTLSPHVGLSKTDIEMYL